MKFLMLIGVTLAFSGAFAADSKKTPSAKTKTPPAVADAVKKTVDACAIPMDDTCTIVEAMPNTKGPKFTMERVDEYTCLLNCPGKSKVNCADKTDSKVDRKICVHNPKNYKYIHCECLGEE